MRDVTANDMRRVSIPGRKSDIALTLEAEAGDNFSCDGKVYCLTYTGWTWDPDDRQNIMFVGRAEPV